MKTIIIIDNNNIIIIIIDNDNDRDNTGKMIAIIVLQHNCGTHRFV